MLEPVRENFVGDGTQKINPYTGEIEPYYSRATRTIRFIESALISVPMFILVFVFLVFWYNVTGVILPDSKHAAFHFAFLSWMAEPDAIFDATSNWAYITTILQVVTTMFMN